MKAEKLGKAAPCSASTIEHLAGTAPGPLNRWILLELSGAYEADILESSGIPANLRTKIKELLDIHPHTRFQGIRQPGRKRAPSLIVSDMRGDSSTLWRYDLKSKSPEKHALAELEGEILQALASLERGAPLAQEESEREESEHKELGTSAWLPYESEKLFLTCTHGRRDPCCARLGMPIARALAASAGPEAWQTSHLGGHRFAPIVSILPEGLSYGRITPEQVPALVEAHKNGKIFDLAHYRGNSHFPPAAQFAEWSWRQKTGNLDIGTWKLVDCTEVSSMRWRIRFRTAAGGSTTEQLEVRRFGLSVMRPASCFAEPSEAFAFSCE